MEEGRQPSTVNRCQHAVSPWYTQRRAFIHTRLCARGISCYLMRCPPGREIVHFVPRLPAQCVVLKKRKWSMSARGANNHRCAARAPRYRPRAHAGEWFRCLSVWGGGEGSVACGVVVVVRFRHHARPFIRSHAPPAPVPGGKAGGGGGRWGGVRLGSGAVGAAW